MDQQTYLKIADGCLEQVIDWLEAFDPDEVDFTSSDGVLKLEFPDGKVYVLNRQSAVEQMWFAAGARAWHYDWNGSTWLCDKDQHELLAQLATSVSEKIGRTVSF